MKLKIQIITGVALLVAIQLISPSLQQPLYAVCEDGGEGVSLGEVNKGDCAKETAFEFNNKTTDVGIKDLVKELLLFASAAVGVAVVAGIIVGGIRYTTSQGNPAGVKKGQTIIANSVLGLVLYLLMFAIINFLIPGGVLS